MRSIFLGILLLTVSLFAAGADFSEMSTQELLAIMGYVPKNDEKALHNELRSRVPSMSKREKDLYQKQLSRPSGKR